MIFLLTFPLKARQICLRNIKYYVIDLIYYNNETVKLYKKELTK